MEHAEQVPNVEELVFHGVAEIEPESSGSTALAAAIDCCRNAASGRADELPQVEGCPAFAMSREGELERAWPDAKSNALQHDLARRFLDIDEICISIDDSPRLYRMDWTAMAVQGTEYLLVCPYGRDHGSGPAAGVVALCVTSLVYGGDAHAGHGGSDGRSDGRSRDDQGGKR